MRPEELEKLLGGYATGTLTGQERGALFRAALSNQELFNALADEQALKELLDDPDSRRQLLSALQPGRRPFVRRFAVWFGRPAAWAVAGGAAAALVVAIVALRLSGPVVTPEPPREAMREAPASPETTYSVQTPPSPPPLQPAEKQGGGSAAGRFPAPAPLPPPARKPQAGTGVAQMLSVAGARELYYGGQGPAMAAVSRSTAETTAVQGGVGGAGAKPEDAAKAPAEVNVTAGSPQQTLGVRYSLLRSAGEGPYSDVDRQTVFRAGEQIRLSVEPNEDGYLYVMLENTAGAWELLFDHRVERRARYIIPTAGPIELAETAGELKLLVVLSREAAAEAGSASTRLRPADQESQASRLNVLARDLRAGVEERTFLTEKVNEAATGGRKQEVVYVVAPPAERTRRVVVEIPVKYR